MKLIGLSDQFVHLLGTGLVGMGIMDFMDEEEGESIEADSGDGDDLFGDGMGGGDAGGEMDEGFGGMDDGMDDGMGMDGEMDDWADDGGDEFAMGGGGGGGPTQELENRIDELENEVAEISSTVSTVRSENEQISAKVDETEENVRKLLEIYEMVTRGVNPFVDDVQGGGMAAGGEAFGEGDDAGSFGLFEDDDEDEPEEDLNEDIADAEAESFFDDDFDDADEEFEDGADEELDGDADEAFGDDAGDDLGFDSPDEGMADEGFGSDAAETENGGGDGGQAGGSTFAELKEEYESGEADWADEEGGTEDSRPEPEPELNAEPEPELNAEPEPELNADPEPEPTVETDVAADEPEDGDFEFDEPADTEPAETRPAETATPAKPNSGVGKPYLAELPRGYVSDLVVMEWLEFLVTEFGPEDAVRTVQYYGDIGWISESVEEELLAFVSGFADVDSVDTEETGPAALEIDDHIQSLTFLSQLTGDAVQRKIVEHCAQIRGGRDGIQR